MSRSAATDPSSPPFGIEARHIGDSSRGGLRRLLKALVIGLPLLAALLGYLGGGAPSVFRAASPRAALTVETPGILRGGNWFETRMIVEPRVDVADLAIAVDQRLWRRMSVDTLIPDPESVEATDGRYTYRFGPLRAGERLVVKIDGQIQPTGPRRLQGRVSARDGERVLASAPVSVVVLP